jgi:hypothetical protein
MKYTSAVQVASLYKFRDKSRMLRGGVVMLER